jgi:DNA mismatch repair protein MutS2
MSAFDLHTLEVLEFPKILSILKGLCLTRYGVAAAEYISPSTDLDAIQTRLEEVSQMKDIIRFAENFPLYRLEDISELIRKSKTRGHHLDPKELLEIRALLKVCAGLHSYSRSERDNFPLIAYYLEELYPLPHIEKEIDRSIDPDGEILDSASPELGRIRSEIGRSRQNIIGRLTRILTSRTKAPGWQDDTIMQRDGRYVIPVVAGQFRSNSGIIHDRSHSGATLFVEPNEIIESNNKLALLLKEEQNEVNRILRHITAMVGEHAESILSNSQIIGILDIIHAAANLSIKIDGDKPVVIREPRFNLKKASHPLLLYYKKDKDSIIPNDFSLDGTRLILIITGPNTGGKTVALKTVGLSILMAQAGLHIAAASDSETGMFRSVFADIGDEQSIELSLSTFSSRLRHVIYAVRNAGPASLVLLDEIGAGTDPKEGSALAESIILKMIELKARTLVTTHYSQLKTLPMLHPEIENASFEFDRGSLKPTFRLLVGIPGASYAVEIARRLGLAEDVVALATALLGKGERSLTDLINSLEKELSHLRNDKAALEEKLKKASDLEKYYSSRIETIETEIESTKRMHLDELEKVLNESRAEIERLVKNIRESKAAETAVKQAHGFLKKSREDLKGLKTKHTPGAVPEGELLLGDRVWIEPLKSEGELVGWAGDNKVKVRVGNILSMVEKSQLKKIKPAQDSEYRKKAGVKIQELSVPGPEIDLRGMIVEEAREALDKFLDSAVLSGMHQVYVIHGKGTGALRKSLTEFLKSHAAIESIRLGDWNEGGAGVTVVKLK